jgi:hypothetical protein
MRQVNVMSTIASITQNSSGNRKPIVRRKGSLPIIKTWHTKRNADDWARTTEDEIARGIYIRRKESERTAIDEALACYLAEIAPGHGSHSRQSDLRKAKPFREHLGAKSPRR